MVLQSLEYILFGYMDPQGLPMGQVLKNPRLHRKLPYETTMLSPSTQLLGPWSPDSASWPMLGSFGPLRALN